MARASVADGVEAIAVTPHVHPGRYDNTRVMIERHARAYQAALELHGIPLKVFSGGEVRLCYETLQMIEMGQVPFLGRVNGADILLLEFPHQHIPVGSEQYINKLLGMNIRPLIAHPERNKTIMSDYTRIRPFVDAGCWLQLTGGSIVGDFGAPAQRTALRLLDDDLAHVVASDAHNMTHRPPGLGRARDFVASHYGDDAARFLFHDMPARIVGIP
jgi:protein-tyrosine phosphatase